MFGERHDLLHEFPEHHDRIEKLIRENPTFAELYQEYEDIDGEIYRIEEQIETPSDDYTESRKKRRAWLKDQLYAMLQDNKQ